MAPHSSTLAWKIPWTEEPGRLQSVGLLRVGQDWATSLSLFTFHYIGEGNGNPLQCSCLGNPRDGGAWWAAVFGVAQSRTRLKWLSSSSRMGDTVRTAGQLKGEPTFEQESLVHFFTHGTRSGIGVLGVLCWLHEEPILGGGRVRQVPSPCGIGEETGYTA